MTYTISKEFAFSASHILHGLADGHPCGRMHGHNYVVRLELTGPVGRLGFVVDYRDLDPFKKWLDDTLDHRHINHVMPESYGNPTAENMAHWMHRQALTLLDLPAGVEVAVSVSETPKTWATYRFDSPEVPRV